MTDVALGTRLMLSLEGYVLAILDNFSRKGASYQVKLAKTITVDQFSLGWLAKFSLSTNFSMVTDNGSHFSFESLQLLQKACRFGQKFSIANAPFTNKNVQKINSFILTQLKQL